eukprot:TRINITY_DN5522_c0_g5_i1.p1 TRINITY_DN5522_c0_g5~~TRINITY_DN5522_c0_g5_i1.p1  ORF type:complete len:218 (+),score=23.10 TRINITY_DN5522_c0_g5_i1:81-656(+)
MTSVDRMVGEPVVLYEGLPVLQHVEARHEKVFGKVMRGRPVVHYLNDVTKISSKGRRQRRVLLVSRSLFLSSVKGEIKRCIGPADVSEILIVPMSRTIAFRIPEQHDLLLELSDEKELECLIKILHSLLPSEKFTYLDGARFQKRDFEPVLQMRKKNTFGMRLHVIPKLPEHRPEQEVHAPAIPHRESSES